MNLVAKPIRSNSFWRFILCRKFQIVGFGTKLNQQELWEKKTIISKIIMCGVR